MRIKSPTFEFLQAQITLENNCFEKVRTKHIIMMLIKHCLNSHFKIYPDGRD